MAIAFDTTSSGSANATSLTVSHTCTGTNLFLFVIVRDLNNTLTGVTYNSVSMTQVGSTQSVGGNNISVWRLFGPATGANDIVATKSSGTSNIRISAASYSGVNQSALDASGQDTAGSTDPWTQALTSIADNCWHLWGVGNNSGTETAAGTATTLRVSNTGFNSILDSNGPKTPAGSVTLEANAGALPDVWGGTMVTIAPFTAVGPANIASINGIAAANIASFNGTTYADITSINGIS